MAVPDSDAVKQFYKLSDAAFKVAVQSLFPSAAEAFAATVAAARPLFDADSLCVVLPLVEQARACLGAAGQSAAPEEAVALFAKAQALAADFRSTLTGRLGDAPVVKPRPEEASYFVRDLIMSTEMMARRALPLSAKSNLATRYGPLAGYAAGVKAAAVCLTLCFPHAMGYEVASPLVDEERAASQAFVLQVVDSFAAVPHAGFSLLEEDNFVNVIRGLSSPDGSVVADEFLHALLTKWSSDAVRAALVARKVIHDGVAGLGRVAQPASSAPAPAPQPQALPPPLRACGLPSCGKVEPVFGKYDRCSACLSVAYCSAEHGVAHWRAGHKKECAKLKAAAEAGAALQSLAV